MNYKAFLFDLNGTMVNDMDYHVNAWYHILKALGADITMEKTKQECYGKNNELLERIFPGRFTEAEKYRISIDKETEYQKSFRPSLKLLPGLDDFLEKYYQKGIRMAIGSAAIMSNVDFVIDGTGVRKYFDAIISADEVQLSKPDPETFTECAKRLKVEPEECLVFEDAPKGVESAMNAGMKCIVLTTMHEEKDFSVYDNIINFSPDYRSLAL